MYIHLCTYIRRNLFTYALCTYIKVDIYIHICLLCIYKHIYVYIHIHMYTYMYIYTHIFIGVYRFVNIYLQEYVSCLQRIESRMFSRPNESR